MATLRFKNTMTRQIAEFSSIEPGLVRMYTCGPTVYDYVHIGNLRTFLFEDILRRTLKLFGYKVIQVMNLTDVDDKTIRGSRREGISLDEYTAKYIEAFFQDIDTLRIERAEHYPRATRFIPQMVELVKKLMERGHTYEMGGSIYYRISTFPDYGKLSGIKVDKNIAGARVDADEYEKEDAHDFVLWKARKEGEPYWDTELGPGRPGWHLECSAMSMSILGETFDIHTGGVDNIFPHHENEIAQSEGATGKPFVLWWLHSEHLIVEGEKMAKSKGNFFTLRDLLAKGYDPVAIRYLLISVPYRQKLNFTFSGLEAAAAAVERVENLWQRLREAEPSRDGGVLEPGRPEKFTEAFKEALGDDLNTARALAELHEFITDVNRALDSGGLSEDELQSVIQALTTADSVLALLPAGEGKEALGVDPQLVERLIAERAEARAKKDWATADEIRDRLAAMGVVVEDTPTGTRWRVSRRKRQQR